MSVRTISATDWNNTKNTLNTLITNCNSVFFTAYDPAGQSTVSRTVASGDNIRAADYSDADGLVTKYNDMRTYESCRYRDAGTTSVVGTWHYGQTVKSASFLGRRDGSFPANTPPYITPPVVGEDIKNIVSGRDILEIINDGSTIHRSTILVAAGAEYVVLDYCHYLCWCHDNCNRSRR